MIKTLKTILLQDKEKYRVPKKIQDIIPIKCLQKKNWNTAVVSLHQKGGRVIAVYLTQPD